MTKYELIKAGYQPEQIISCPLNNHQEKCPCETGEQVSCGLASLVNLETTGESHEHQRNK
jgi:hypothetical protein